MRCCGIGTLGSLLVACTTALVAVSARSEVPDGSVMYRCPPDSTGRVDYTNNITKAQAAKRGCVLVTDWIAYGNDSDGTRYEYSERRVSTEPSLRTVKTWVRVKFTKSGSLVWKDGRTQVYDEMTSPVTFYCQQLTYQQGVAYYTNSGKPVWTDEGYKSALPPPPDTALETLMQKLCADAFPK